MVVDTKKMIKPYVPAIKRVVVMGMSDRDDSGTNLILRESVNGQDRRIIGYSIKE